MNDFFELVVGATASGCIYGLVALAYLLMTRPTGIINFAVGEWAMMAAFAGVVIGGGGRCVPIPVQCFEWVRGYRICTMVAQHHHHFLADGCEFSNRQLGSVFFQHLGRTIAVVANRPSA